jgi:Carbohydrate esterase, sialic acid-specific acetylesterase
MKRIVFSLFLAICALRAQTLRVTGGAVDEQVFQRDTAGVAAIPLSGVAQGADGRSVEALVSRKHVLLRDWAPVGKISGGAWTAAINALPAGGPYRIDLRVSGGPVVAVVNNILVGDLWMLAGQSNMEGVGDLVDVEMPHELVHSFDMTDQWIVAEEPLHTLPAAVDPVHQEIRKLPERLTGEKLRQFISARKKGAGLGLPFAVEMVRRTGVPVGLIPSAHGGTSMDQWDPALKSQGGHSLYGGMLRRFHAAGSKITGVLWYQGESDANPKASPVFQDKFERFVRLLREDFGQPELPFYYVQIGRHVNAQNLAEWNLVQEMQRKAESTLSHMGMAVAVDFSLDDGIHVSTQDHKRLGRRLANLAQGVRGPRPVSATFRDGVVRVEFADVNGKLTSDGRLSGFSIHGADGASLPLIFKMRVDPGNPSAALLHIGGKLPEGATLRYGFGKDPYCNLRDEKDMAVPVFGPMAISQ